MNATAGKTLDPRSLVAAEFMLLATSLPRNGYSAPAILSWYFPPDATRSWQAGPDGPPRLAAIDHRRPAAGYVDPALFPAADWADDLHRDADGRLTGWTRRRDGRPAEEFDATGRRRVGDGTVAVVHAIRRTADGRFALEEQDAPPE